MDSTTPALAAYAAHDEAAIRDTHTAEDAINVPPTLPLELVLHILKLSLEGHRSGSNESKRALSTCSLVSKGVSDWAQKKLFEYVCLPEEQDALDVPDILGDRPELGAVVRVLELGGEAWGFFQFSSEDMHQLLNSCPAYKRGELTLKLSGVEFSFSRLHGIVKLIGGLILDQVDLHYDESDYCDYDEASGPSLDIFPHLKTLEVSRSLDFVQDFERLDPKEFPALTALIQHSGMEGGIMDPLFAFQRLRPQLTSMYIERSDGLSFKTLPKYTNLILLDLPLASLAAASYSARKRRDTNAEQLPPALRTLRIRFDPDGLTEDALDDLAALAEGTLKVLLRCLEREGEAQLKRLVLPEELQEWDLTSWDEFMRVVEREGVVVEFEKAGAEDDVEVFEALRKEMGVARRDRDR